MDNKNCNNMNMQNTSDVRYKRIVQQNIKKDIEQKKLLETPIVEKAHKNNEKPSNIQKKKGKQTSYRKSARAWYSETSSESSSSNNDDDEEDDYSEDESQSDHEFSPEIGFDDNANAKPIKRARTSRMESDDCLKCGQSGSFKWILLCDGCNSGWHGSCLKPAVYVIPEGKWYCPDCQHSSLLQNLKNTLKMFDRRLKRRETEKRRKERLACSNISQVNVLPTTIEPVKRTTRVRTYRFDPKLINYSSDDDIKPAKKKTKLLSDKEESDCWWCENTSEDNITEEEEIKFEVNVHPKEEDTKKDKSKRVISENVDVLKKVHAKQEVINNEDGINRRTRRGKKVNYKY